LLATGPRALGVAGRQGPFAAAADPLSEASSGLAPVGMQSKIALRTILATAASVAFSILASVKLL
jgi:hypothetical protein